MRPSIVLSCLFVIILVYSTPGLGGSANADEKDKDSPKSLHIDAIISGLNRYAAKAKEAETTAQKQDVLQRMIKAMPANIDGRAFKFLCKVKDVKKVGPAEVDIWDVKIEVTREFKKYHEKKFKIGDVSFSRPKAVRVTMTSEQALKVGKGDLMQVTGTASYDPKLSIYVTKNSVFKICSFEVGSINTGSIVSTDYTCRFKDFEAKSPY